MPPFLATTALREFWDTKAEKIVFLGRWCMRYDAKEYWKELNYEVLPYPWDDRAAMHKAAEYEERVAESLLAALSDFLSHAHAERHGIEYWRMILYPWLIHYVQALHERYLCLRNALDLYPECYTVTLHADSFRTPRFFGDHLRGCFDDPYNLQLYTNLFLAMGCEFPSKQLVWEWDEPRPTLTWKRPRWAYRVKSFLDPLMTRWAFRAPVVMVAMYVPRRDVFKIMWKTRFRARSAQLPKNDEWDVSIKGIQNPIRQELASLSVNCRDEFMKVLIKTLPTNFPLLYLEGYPVIQAWAKTCLKNSKAGVFITANAIDGNEPFKVLCAQAKEEGSTLIGVQHGGNYGSAKYNPFERYEREASDEFWSWGWQEDEGAIHPMPNPKMSQFAALRKRRKKGGRRRILFIGNIVPRYHYRTWSCPTANQVEAYLDWQVLFLRALHKNIRDSLVFRPYPQDWGWCLRQRLADACPDLNFTDPREDYYAALVAADLVVCDMNQTTLLETLSANIPTIAFWDPNLWELRLDAEDNFNALRNAGILFSKPEDAAAALNERWPNVSVWWDKEQLQAARRDFASRYALTSPDWLSIWTKQLQCYAQAPARHLREKRCS
jgi:putative transferase (TIGR04331 family)